jgi:hypothetical protein
MTNHMQVMHATENMMVDSKNHLLKKDAIAAKATAERNGGLQQKGDSESALLGDGGGSGSRGKITS